jgi:MerR family transcriptional regulator/heat shock protein HspR
MRYEDDIDSPLFMISVAAELAGMHPQTLRVYERRGLLRPQRSAKNTRRYSRRDVERLRRIQELTDLGLNLAGVERVLAMEERLAVMAHEIDGLHTRLIAAADEMRRAVAEAERGRRFDLVPLRSMALVPLPRRRRGR